MADAQSAESAENEAKGNGQSAEAMAAPEDPAATDSAVTWDDSQMVTHFANVVNIQSTLEQVDLFFGTNKTWNVANERHVKVELTNRVILGPYAAKRLWITLGGVLKEYESRYGELRVQR